MINAPWYEVGALLVLMALVMTSFLRKSSNPRGLTLAYTFIYLGFMYRDGQGVPQNDARAYMWWSVLAAQGEESSRSYRDSIAAKLTPEQLAQGQDMATKCFESNDQDCE